MNRTTMRRQPPQLVSHLAVAARSLTIAALLLTIGVGSALAGGSKSLSTARSSLSWPSGMACWSHSDSPMEQTEAWRGRKFDVILGFAPKQSWNQTVAYFEKGHFRNIAKQDARPVISTPLLTEDTAGRFDKCAGGAYDEHFRRIGKAAQAQGGDTVFRLGWEANGSWFPWSIGNNPDGYKACFRRAVSMIRKEFPAAAIEWPMGKRGHLSFDVTRAYPGDDYVDMVGLSFYDSYPSFTSHSVWDAAYWQTQNGGPFGLGQWLAFAKAHKKKLAFGEWGIFHGRGSDDNPVFVESMVDFFRKNASSIGYEAYFNCREKTHQVYPSSYNPKSSSTYRKLYQAG